MPDDNKQQDNTNKNDDLNLNFDIVLDQNEDLNKKINDNITVDKSNLNFDINTEIKVEETTNETAQQLEIGTTKEGDNSYNPDLKSVNDTIQQLQEAREQKKQTISSNELNEIPTVQIINTNIIKEDIEEEKNKISKGIINLDEILLNTESKNQNYIQETPQIQFPESIQQQTNPYDTVPQKPIIQTNINEHKKHLIMVIGIVIICVIAGIFILKTMYPVQLGPNNGLSGDNLDTTIHEANPFQEPTIPLESTGTYENIVELTGNIDNLSGNFENKNSTGEADPFQDLDNLQTQDELKKQATIDSLKDFASKGQYYLDLGKQKGIKDMIKYGVYLTGKATPFINQIENGEILDISSLDTYIAQFSISLQKLQNLENESNTSLQEQNDIQKQNTGVQNEGSTGEYTQL